MRVQTRRIVSGLSTPSHDALKNLQGGKMKKLIFLLIMAIFLAGVMPAMEVAYPPGATVLDIALPGYIADSRVVTPDTVLTIAAPLSAGQQVSLSALPAITNITDLAGQPQGYYLIKPMDKAQEAITGYFTRPDYWLRL